MEDKQERQVAKKSQREREGSYNSSDGVTNGAGVAPRTGGGREKVRTPARWLHVHAFVSRMWPLAEMDVLEPGSAPTGISR